MSLRFIGIDPNAGAGESPTVWVDEDAQELILQGWTAGPELTAQCAEFEVPRHAKGIPDDESVIRVPARMVPMLREACDAAERAQLR